MRELRIEKDKERREGELERMIKEVEWKAVRKRRREEGKRERGKEEKENALEGERERESARRRKGWLARGRECKEIDRRLTAKKEEVVE